jgi:hypothetical protein
MHLVNHVSLVYTSGSNGSFDTFSHPLHDHMSGLSGHVIHELSYEPHYHVLAGHFISSHDYLLCCFLMTFFIALMVKHVCLFLARSAIMLHSM